MNPKELALFLSLLALVGGWVWLIAPTGEKRRTIGLAVLGLFLALGKIWLFQQAPQWQDINPDSVAYDLHARAFVLHWQGETVPIEEYRLRGLMSLRHAGLTGTDWEPGNSFSWSTVLGTHEWLYTAYVASWYGLADASQNIVIFSNAIWAAFFPVAAFVLVLALGGSRKVAFLAAAFALVDPSAGANASWLLKDTLISFLAMSCLCIALRLTREGSWRFVLCFVFFAGLLSSGRYGAFFGLLCAMVLVLIHFVVRRQMKQVGIFVVMMLLAFEMSNVIKNVPNVHNSWFITHSFSPLTGAAKVFGRGADDARADETVVRWKAAFAENPPLAIIKSIGRTLFAPNLWAAISPGPTWHFSHEMYYPGMLLWMFCLLGIFWARGLRDPAFWLLVLFLASQWVCYTLFFGEWSGRQRVFALPAFFALAAMGYANLYRRFRGVTP